MKYYSQRRALLEAAKKINAEGINHGTSGNVSMRVEDGLVITPTGMAYDELSPEDLVEVRWDGGVPGGQRAPSSEWQMHRDLYQAREDAGAILHTHPMFCTSLSCLRKPIPAVHYMIAVTGATVVQCARYETFGTSELSAAAGEALRGSKACLLANHGMVALGKNLHEAHRVASEVENLAAQYWRALQVGQPHILDEAEMARVLERFATYGQQPKSGRTRSG